MATMGRTPEKYAKFPKTRKKKGYTPTEGSLFWEENKSALLKYFANVRSFSTWIGWHEAELPDKYDLEAIITLKKRLNRRRYNNK